MPRHHSIDEPQPAPIERRNAGFSLVEALVVVGLVAIVAFIALPRLAVPDAIQARLPARQLAADLRLAQRLAIARHVDYMLDMSPGTAPYTQYSVHPLGGPAESDFPRTFDPGVAVSGAVQFQFRSDGTAVASGSVTLTSGGSTAVVQVIAATGHVTVTGP